MSQPPQKAADIWDLVEHSRWEDLERSHPFIELNIPECSPRLSRDETTHQPGKRQVQSPAKHSGVHRWVGLGIPTGGKSHPGAPIPTWTPTTMSGGEKLQGKVEQAEYNHLHLNNTCNIQQINCIDNKYPGWPDTGYNYSYPDILMHYSWGAQLAHECQEFFV